jgi:hypothetical protein
VMVAAPATGEDAGCQIYRCCRSSSGCVSE